MRKTCVGSVSLVLLCASCEGPLVQTEAPQFVPALTANCSLKVGRLEGPIDPELPTHGIILHDFRVCAGSDNRVAVVWTRNDWLFARAADWDAEAKTWRHKETGQTYRPSTPGLAPDGKPYSPSRGTIFPRGQCVGAAIISPKGVLKRAFLETVDADDGPENYFVGPLIPQDDSWTVGFNLLYPFLGNSVDPRQRQPNPRVQFVALDESGWGNPSPARDSQVGRGIQVAGKESRGGFFFLEYFHLPSDPPDFAGGHERERLNYVPLSELGKSRVIYTCPYECAEDKHQIVSMGSERYDLIARRYRPPGLRSGESYQIIHVFDLLRGGERQAEVIGQCPNGTMPVAIRRGADLQVLWLSPPIIGSGDEARRGFDLMEIHYDGGAWSKPHAVCHAASAVCSELAVASRPDGVAIAVWPSGDGEHRLTYSVSSAGHDWSIPQATNVKIGWKSNTLVAVDSGFFLFTNGEDPRNRYWCYLQVEDRQPLTLLRDDRRRAVPQPAQNAGSCEIPIAHVGSRDSFPAP